MNELTAKVAIVTGASAGIGRATAFALAAEGATVVVADLDDIRGEQVAAEINDKGGTARYIHADVTNDAQVAALVARRSKRSAALISPSTTRASREPGGHSRVHA